MTFFQMLCACICIWHGNFHGFLFLKKKGKNSCSKEAGPNIRCVRWILKIENNNILTPLKGHPSAWTFFLPLRSFPKWNFALLSRGTNAPHVLAEKSSPYLSSLSLVFCYGLSIHSTILGPSVNSVPIGFHRAQERRWIHNSPSIGAPFFQFQSLTVLVWACIFLRPLVHSLWEGSVTQAHTLDWWEWCLHRLQ